MRYPVDVKLEHVVDGGLYRVIGLGDLGVASDVEYRDMMRDEFGYAGSCPVLGLLFRTEPSLGGGRAAAPEQDDGLWLPDVNFRAFDADANVVLAQAGSALSAHRSGPGVVEGVAGVWPLLETIMTMEVELVPARSDWPTVQLLFNRSSGFNGPTVPSGT